MTKQEAARIAGRASVASGRGYRWTAEEARAFSARGVASPRRYRWDAEAAARWGRLGGQCTQELKRRRESASLAAPQED